MEDPAELLTVPQAAQAAGVSQHLIRRKAKEGALPVFAEAAGRRLFRREDVQFFIDKRRARALSDGRIRVPEKD
jgi:predicted site-specific integrase-resolvase